MKLRKEILDKIQNIIHDEHDDNMSEFSRQTGINKSYICDVLNNKRGVGTSFIMKINDYCKKNNIKKINFF